MKDFKVLDSGERREFESGAVRDIQRGKGRCDLLPLDVCASLMLDNYSRHVIDKIGSFLKDGDISKLYIALDDFCELSKKSITIDRNILEEYNTPAAMLLDVAKQYEDGAVKYGEHNWEKGIPVHCFIDSAVRHFLKLLDGWDDEPHQRAFVWNILGAIWTCKHRPDLVDCIYNQEVELPR